MHFTDMLVGGRGPPTRDHISETAALLPKTTKPSLPGEGLVGMILKVCNDMRVVHSIHDFCSLVQSSLFRFDGNLGPWRGQISQHSWKDEPCMNTHTLTLPADSGTITDLAWSPDGNEVAAVTANGYLHLWSTKYVTLTAL